MASDLKNSLTKEYVGMELWVIIVVCLGLVCVFVLVVSLWLSFRKKSRRENNMPPVSYMPKVSEEIKEIGVDQNSAHNDGFPSLHDKFGDKEEADKALIQLENGDDSSQSGSFNHVEKVGVGSQSGEEGGTKVASVHRPSSHPLTAPSPLSGLPEFSQLGWGHWFTLRDLQVATNRFSKDNIIGDGGYGVVYQGHMINGTPVAVKKLLNNPGQADKDFRVEVEAIGHVRHKNLVRLLGYCMEGTQRMLVYEYVNNGNLEQWLRGGMRQHGYLTWEARMKILLGTAKALAYLHEAIEPKVVHRDIKSSNILIDDNFDAKISDFGLAKLLGAGKSHITTRVMGTFGYVAPEYANSGLLNEKSDVYSFGVVLLEAITGRDPVDYDRPENEVNLVEWLKMMVAGRRSEEVVDPMIENRPATSALKRALLTALRCVDPDAEKRPKMSQVVRMLESEEYPIPRQDRRRWRSHAGEGETA
ncbi:receptor-like protein kinase [Populus alba x Populus x berolinensis]|uniref:non-specific serine/threonine protein kinase n=2 Tax=Populus alba x Populus x berolinensis TaxID=444605 RepID=A0AAD6MAN4_9ROSI|nr:probable receptor-like protein kinase At5g18500 [Populus alba]KAJ6897749.1 receptor-like protein kinase [Populus alba x Populus x berolinensis]KAJ6980777.1 receptor-like protein kinase [Populus alba x Populus x berolinensis]